MSARQEVLATLTQHGVEDALSAAVNAAIKSQQHGGDDDPIKAIARALLKPRAQPLSEVQADTSTTCVARVQAALDAIGARSELNACCEVMASSALQQAAAADARLASGGARRLLEGVPIVVKANIDVAGTLTTASMPGLANWRPQSTAPVAARLIEAGAVVIAKTSMPEAAMFGMGFSPVHGVTLNPVNRHVTTAGSSSGTAACIGAGMVAGGLGSDTGGSLRMPAEACGIAGFRPSYRRYPSGGVVPADPVRDTTGPMAASVADLAVLDAAIMGGDLGEYAPAPLEGLGVAVPADVQAAASEGHKRALELALGALRAAGAAVNVAAADFEDLKKLEGLAHSSELSHHALALDEYLASHPSSGLTRDGVLGASFHRGVEAFFTDASAWTPPGTTRVMLHELPANERDALLATRDDELRAMEAAYSRYFEAHACDVMVTPAFAGPPAKCLTDAEYRAFPDQLSMLLQGGGRPMMAYVMAFTTLRVPCLALPTPARHEGLDIPGPPPPAGLLLWGRPHDDKKLLKVGIALEAAMKQQPPPQ